MQTHEEDDITTFDRGIPARGIVANPPDSWSANKRSPVSLKAGDTNNSLSLARFEPVSSDHYIHAHKLHKASFRYGFK